VRVIGIDPGTALLGFGVIDVDDQPELVDFGAIATPSGDAMPARLLALHTAVLELLERYRPEVMAVEQLFFARNVTTAITVGQARGVALLAGAQHGVTVVEYTPSQIKQAVSGYGKADKPQMQEMVRIMLGLESVPHPDDAADALAVALCHGQRRGFAERTAAAWSDES
jgi:crossover junction endodeoxyribonuclease RuvC